MASIQYMLIALVVLLAVLPREGENRRRDAIIRDLPTVVCLHTIVQMSRLMQSSDNSSDKIGYYATGIAIDEHPEKCVQVKADAMRAKLSAKT